MIQSYPIAKVLFTGPDAAPAHLFQLSAAAYAYSAAAMAAFTFASMFTANDLGAKFPVTVATARLDFIRKES